MSKMDMDVSRKNLDEIVEDAKKLREQAIKLTKLTHYSWKLPIDKKTDKFVGLFNGNVMDLIRLCSSNISRDADAMIFISEAYDDYPKNADTFFRNIYIRIKNILLDSVSTINNINKCKEYLNELMENFHEKPNELDIIKSNVLKMLDLYIKYNSKCKDISEQCYKFFIITGNDYWSFE
jgi:hypothetical protein